MQQIKHMKKLFVTSMLLAIFIVNSFAQSGSPKAAELLKQLQQKPGSFEATVNDKKISGKSILVKLENGKGFAITNDLISGNSQMALALKISKIVPGKYDTEKDENMIIADGINYVIREGEITITEKAGKISGSFTGNLYSIDKRKSKFNVPAGKVRGTFSNLIKP
jgi:hypothetical protein